MKKLLLRLILFYQRQVSAHTAPCCRFMPTCSAYALTAVERYGALRGGWMALRRVCCCHPFYRGRRGLYDPVPERKSAKEVRSKL